MSFDPKFNHQAETLIEALGFESPEEMIEFIKSSINTIKDPKDMTNEMMFACSLILLLDPKLVIELLDYNPLAAFCLDNMKKSEIAEFFYELLKRDIHFRYFVWGCMKTLFRSSEMIVDMLYAIITESMKKPTIGGVYVEPKTQNLN